MKRKIGIAIIGLLLSGSISNVFGQENGEQHHFDYKHEQMEKKTPEEKAKIRTERMKKELGLTAEQEAKVYELNLSHAKKMDELHEERKALMEKMKAEKDGMKTSLEGVLTEEQMKKVEEHMQQRREHHEKMKHKQCGPPQD